MICELLPFTIFKSIGLATGHRQDIKFRKQVLRATQIGQKLFFELWVSTTRYNRNFLNSEQFAKQFANSRRYRRLTLGQRAVKIKNYQFIICVHYKLSTTAISARFFIMY